MAEKRETSQLDELEKGPWPSFVTQIKRAGEKNAMADDLLGLLEKSYEDKVGHWKHGGIVGVKGYGGGVIGRYTDHARGCSPNISAVPHGARGPAQRLVLHERHACASICDVWEERGSGLTNMHGSTGDIILLGTHTDAACSPSSTTSAIAGSTWAAPAPNLRYAELPAWDPSRCEHACYDTLDTVLST